MISLEGGTIGYGRTPLMGALTFRIRRGDFWGIVGPNGGGKTTLVKTLIGILPPVSGALHFLQGPPRFGYVPQRHEVASRFPLSAFDVVFMGRYAAGRADDDRDRALRQLDRVDMRRWADHRFDGLSGGQKQRVLLARALASEPEVLVLDEPTTGMDLPGETSILAFLRDLHAAGGLTVIMIGHHISSVVSVADHLCLINKDANLFETGALDEMLTAKRLSAAYGRPIQVDRAQGAIHVRASQEVGHG
jgi:zinc transport system ATP-binding protein